MNAETPLPKAFRRKLEAVGDHIRTVRLGRGLDQVQVAEILGVTEGTVCNWENRRNSPRVSKCGVIIGFLGYDPFPKPQTFREELVSFRRLRGLRVRDAAALAGIDPCSWTSRERGEHRITTSAVNELKAFCSHDHNMPSKIMKTDLV